MIGCGSDRSLSVVDIWNGTPTFQVLFPEDWPALSIASQVTPPASPLGTSIDNSRFEYVIANPASPLQLTSRPDTPASSSNQF